MTGADLADRLAVRVPPMTYGGHRLEGAELVAVDFSDVRRSRDDAETRLRSVLKPKHRGLIMDQA